MTTLNTMFLRMYFWSNYLAYLNETHGWSKQNEIVSHKIFTSCPSTWGGMLRHNATLFIWGECALLMTDKSQLRLPYGQVSLSPRTSFASQAGRVIRLHLRERMGDELFVSGWEELWHTFKKYVIHRDTCPPAQVSLMDLTLALNESSSLGSDQASLLGAACVSVADLTYGQSRTGLRARNRTTAFRHLPTSGLSGYDKTS